MQPWERLVFQAFYRAGMNIIVVLNIVCGEIVGIPLIWRGHANARLHSQRQSELSAGWQHLLLIARGFSC